jgi:carbon starvation protein
MLAAIALTLCTVVLFKMKRQQYAWVTILPTAWLLVCTLTAGLQKLFHPAPAIGFLAHARRFGAALAAGQVVAPAKSLAEMQRIVVNDYVDAALCAAFVAVVAAMAVFGVVSAWRAWSTPGVTAREVGPGAAIAAGGGDD